MPDARQEALRAAGDAIARIMRRVAAYRTRRTAEAVRTRLEGNEAVIAAGRPEGQYGWEPIQALMFDDDKRHPLFGNKRHWYHQGYFPLTSYTESLSADDAANAYADAVIEPLLDEHGFSKYK